MVAPWLYKSEFEEMVIAVLLSSTTSTPIEDPPNLGFRIYGPSNFGRTYSDTKCFSRTGMLLLFIKAKKAYLSIHN